MFKLLLRLIINGFMDGLWMDLWMIYDHIV